MAKQIDGKRVGRLWFRVLKTAELAGIEFTVTSGRRTLREQAALFRQNMRWSGLRWVQRQGRPLTAFPSPLAPHIRKGRPDHAIDVNALDGGEGRLQRWLEGQGATVLNPVPGEPWHIEVPRSDLVRLFWKLTPRRRRSLSDAGLALICEFEGFRAKPYKDIVGVWTIGYGETKGVGPDTKPWSEAKARRRLRLRVGKDFAPHVHALKVPLNQNQFDALCSFVYNLGPGSIAPSTGIGRALRGKRWRAAADEMLEWNRAGGKVIYGLERRRAAERKLFLSK